MKAVQNLKKKMTFVYFETRFFLATDLQLRFFKTRQTIFFLER